VRPVRLALAVVVLATGLAHSRGLAGGFVYDDHRFVERNAAIESLRDPQRFFLDPTTASAAQGVEADVWRPLRTLAFAADRALFGLDPRGWHLGNVAIHVVNAALVFLLLLRLFAGSSNSPALAGGSARRPESLVAAAAGAGALLFAIHPVTVESVAWVSSRGDLLAWMFVLLALEVGRRRGVPATIAMVTLVVLACLAKESAVVAFALVPLHHLALPAAARPSRRETIVRTVALLLATGAYFAARWAVMPSPADLPAFAQTSFPDGSRAAAARGFLAAIAGYAKALLLPVGFPFDRNVYTDPVPVSWSDPSVLVGLGLLLAVLLAGVVALLRRSGVVAFACFGSLAALVPVSNVIVPLKAFSAERFLYPLMPCLSAGVVAAALALARTLRPALRPVVVVVAAGVLVTLGVLADARTGPWHDELSLWTAVQREEPMNPRAYEGVGFQWLRAGRLSKAEPALRTYAEFQPFDGKVHALLAAELRATYEDLVGQEGYRPNDSDEAQERLRIPPFLLEKAIAESRTAVRVWETLGLERGRGDRKLRRATIEGWRSAALDYLGIPDARAANRLLAFADVRVANRLLAEDDVRDGGVIAFDEERIPVILACLVLGFAAEGETVPDILRRTTRADALEDVGVGPENSDVDAYGLLIERLGALLATHPNDDALRRNRKDAHRARIRLTKPSASASDAEQAAWARGNEGELSAIEEDLRFLVARHSADRALARELESVRSLRGR
jgi:hypothetical protein